MCPHRADLGVCVTQFSPVWQWTFFHFSFFLQHINLTERQSEWSQHTSNLNTLLEFGEGAAATARHSQVSLSILALSLSHPCAVCGVAVSFGSSTGAWTCWWPFRQHNAVLCFDTRVTTMSFVRHATNKHKGPRVQRLHLSPPTRRATPTPDNLSKRNLCCKGLTAAYVCVVVRACVCWQWESCRLVVLWGDESHLSQYWKWPPGRAAAVLTSPALLNHRRKKKIHRTLLKRTEGMSGKSTEVGTGLDWSLVERPLWWLKEWCFSQLQCTASLRIFSSTAGTCTLWG